MHTAGARQHTPSTGRLRQLAVAVCFVGGVVASIASDPPPDFVSGVALTFDDGARLVQRLTLGHRPVSPGGRQAPWTLSVDASCPGCDADDQLLVTLLEDDDAVADAIVSPGSVGPDGVLRGGVAFDRQPRCADCQVDVTVTIERLSAGPFLRGQSVVVELRSSDDIDVTFQPVEASGARPDTDPPPPVDVP
jgi:hypothetical protein